MTSIKYLYIRTYDLPDNRLHKRIVGAAKYYGVYVFFKHRSQNICEIFGDLRTCQLVLLNKICETGTWYSI